ncbi:MAG: toll/interleukin-1 receptor domain-containing protein, partial [Candidatus Riflebacteria bacterium]|nr:toll/interleukin-1 receptor domain-containing protein [Candidatus Riflebacteria bacterium]
MDGYVFISYSHQDQAVADRLTRELDQAGLKWWRDAERIRGGERFTRRLALAIESAEVVIWLGSPDSVESLWVLKEVTFAVELKKRVIPVLVQGFPVASVPEEFRLLFSGLHFLSLETSSWTRVVEALTNVLPPHPSQVHFTVQVTEAYIVAQNSDGTSAQEAVPPDLWRVAREDSFPGEVLYHAVFRGRVREKWNQASGLAGRDSTSRLTLRLLFDEGTRHLLALPWERMRESADSSYLSAKFPVVRVLMRGEDDGHATKLRPLRRVLLVTSSHGG